MNKVSYLWLYPRSFHIFNAAAEIYFILNNKSIMRQIRSETAQQILANILDFAQNGMFFVQG